MSLRYPKGRDREVGNLPGVVVSVVSPLGEGIRPGPEGLSRPGDAHKEISLKLQVVKGPRKEHQDHHPGGEGNPYRRPAELSSSPPEEIGDHQEDKCEVARTDQGRRPGEETRPEKISRSSLFSRTIDEEEGKARQKDRDRLCQKDRHIEEIEGIQGGHEAGGDPHPASEEAAAKEKEDEGVSRVEQGLDESDPKGGFPKEPKEPREEKGIAWQPTGGGHPVDEIALPPQNGAGEGGVLCRVWRGEGHPPPRSWRS